MRAKGKLRIRFTGWIPAIIFYFLILGCGRHNPPSTANVPTVASVEVKQPEVRALSDEEIQNIINSSLNLVHLARLERACNQRPAANMGSTDNVYPGMNQVNGYGVWLKYIADHIKSNTIFDSTYSEVAAGALDVSSWMDITGDACLNFRKIRDVDLVNQIANVDPSTIGQQLFSTFSQYDQSTRDKAAQMLQ